MSVDKETVKRLLRGPRCETCMALKLLKTYPSWYCQVFKEEPTYENLCDCKSYEPDNIQLKYESLSKKGEDIEFSVTFSRRP